LLQFLIFFAKNSAFLDSFSAFLNEVSFEKLSKKLLVISPNEFNSRLSQHLPFLAYYMSIVFFTFFLQRGLGCLLSSSKFTAGFLRVLFYRSSLVYFSSEFIFVLLYKVQRRWSFFQNKIKAVIVCVAMLSRVFRVPL